MPKSSPYRKLAYLLAALPVVAGACLVVYWFGRIAPYRAEANSMLEAELQHMRDQGVPTTLEEMHTWYALPTGVENGAAAYQQAFDAFVRPDRKTLPETEKALLPIMGEYEVLPGAPIGEANMAALKNYLEENKAALDLLKVAAQFEQVRFPRRFEDGMEMEIPEATRIRHAVRLLSMEVMYRGALGDAVGMEAALTAAFAMPGALAQEPGALCQLFRVKSVTIVVGALQDVLCRQQISGECLAKISSYLAQCDGREMLRCAYMGEANFMLLVIDKVAEGSLNPLSGIFGQEVKDSWTAFKGNLALNYLRIIGALEMSKAEYLYFLNGMTDQTHFDWAESLPYWPEWETYMDKVPPRDKILTNLLYPAIVKMRHAVQRNDAVVHLAMLACALERYKLEHSQLPTDLSALMPSFLTELPVDPFSGGALKYQKQEDGYLLYSVGKDGEDDGGVSAENALHFDDTNDVVLAIHRGDLALSQ